MSMTIEYKGYKLIRDSFGFVVKSIGRGSLPTRLCGRFTSIKEVTHHIDTYLASKDS